MVSLRRAVTSLALVSVAMPAVAGTIGGRVTDFPTGNLLEGARIEIPALRRLVLSDATGYYRFPEVPAGEYDVVVTYTGLPAVRQRVAVTSDGAARADYLLDAATRTMAPFHVHEARAGAALAITAQRNADNVKHVVATESYGGIAGTTPADLAIRLPGVAAGLDEDGNVRGIIIRGQNPGANRLTVDGNPLAVSNPLSRASEYHLLPGSMFEELEVTKAHLPDRSVDSVGGATNLVTRSPLALADKRRFTFSVASRFAPGFTEQIPLRRQRAGEPVINGSYQEVFSVLGGERNLGVALNYNYAGTVTGTFRTVRDYQATTAEPAYLYTWATADTVTTRRQTNASARVDYQWSRGTRLSASLLYNATVEPSTRTYEATALTAQSVAAVNAAGVPVDGGAILPNFSNTFTEARALPASIFRVSETMTSSLTRTRAASLSGRHELGRYVADWALHYSEADSGQGSGGGGSFSLDAPGVGWRLDRAASDLYPRFTTTGGPDILNLASYRPMGPLMARNTVRASRIAGLRVNVAHELASSPPSRLGWKTGLDVRQQFSGLESRDRRWNYAGTRPFAAAGVPTWMAERTGFRPPFFEIASFMDGAPLDAAAWVEDRYYGETQKYINTRDATEWTGAAYAMLQGGYERLSFVAGVRLEQSASTGFGWIRQHFASLPAVQLADPVGAARRDWGNGENIASDSAAIYPSAHAQYDFARRLKARASWSSGYSGAPFNMILPQVMVDDANRRLTLSNPDLAPQQAREWDATLEYYFEPAGSLSVGWFHKDIRDYIISGVDRGTIGAGPDNDFNGDYAGYQLLTSENGGRANVNGWELSYQQQFTALPGALRTLRLSANYTFLRTHGTYGGTLYLTTENVAGFVPRTGNVSLNWRYRALGLRARVNYQSDFILTFNAATPARNQYRLARTVTDVGASFALNRNLQLQCDASNVAAAPQVMYRHRRSQMERTLLNGTAWTLGLSGRF